MAKSGSQRTFISLAVFACLAVAFGYFAYVKFIGSKAVDAGPAAPVASAYDVSRYNIGNFDRGLFERADYLLLKPDATIHPPVDAIVTGKPEPFSPPATTTSPL